MKNFSSRIIFIFLFVVSLKLSATHNRSGEILYKRIMPYSTVVGGVTVPLYTYSITVIKYFDSGSGISDRCEDSVYFGDGTKTVAQRINGTGGCGCNNCGVIISGSPYIVKLNIYSCVHTYAGPGTYDVSSSDYNRSVGVINIPNSDQVGFSIHSQIIIGSQTGTNSSPVLTIPPIFMGNLQSCFNFNNGAFDPDGDSLSYALAPCMGGRNQVATGFTYPSGGPNGSFSINPLTGLLSWCNPQQNGIYNIAMEVREWRKTCGGIYQLNGMVERDMQVIISGLPQSFSSASLFSAQCAVAGANFSQSFASNVVAGNTVSVTLYGASRFSENLPNATLSPSMGTTNLNTTFSWQTNCDHIQRLPHQVYFVYQSQFSSFHRQFDLKIIPPAPIVYGITRDTSKVMVHWTGVTACTSTIKGYNIYRKIGATSWTHGTCETGVPASSGFQLIGLAGPTDSVYTDVNLPANENGNTGNYAVTTVMNDCAESFADNIKSISLLVGLSENSFAANVGIYPNPFMNQIEITLPGNYTGTNSVKVVSIDGKLVFKSSLVVVDTKMTLPLGHLQKGIYLLELKTDRATISRKIIKE